MKTGVVIVNYNCARFAIDAALSALGDGAMRAVIVDNKSTDHSRQYFEDVFNGRQRHDAEQLPVDPAPKFANLIQTSKEIISCAKSTNGASLSIIFADENRGFAAGCNIGLRALIREGACDQYILLNPDAVLAKGTVAAFARRLADPSAGLCGASVLRHEAPHPAQAFGGASINKLTLLGDNIGAGRSLADAPERDAVEQRISYPLGAAMACRKDFIEKAGYLDERYFLYYEEADWARAGAAQYKTVWARDAVVYHRHGAAAGSRRAGGGRSAFADYHMARSRMLYAAKWRPILLPFLMISGIAQAARRILRGHLKQAKAVITGVLPGAEKNVSPDF